MLRNWVKAVAIVLPWLVLPSAADVCAALPEAVAGVAATDVAKLTTEAQLDWATTLFGRLTAANRDAAASVVAGDIAAAHQLYDKLIAGRHLSAKGAAKVIAWVDGREAAAVHRRGELLQRELVRLYPERGRPYERRLEAWRSIEIDWKTAGAAASERAKLLAWLDVSLARAKAGSLAKLPVKPKFGETANGDTLVRNVQESPKPSPGAAHVKPITEAPPITEAQPGVREAHASAAPPRHVVGRPVASATQQPTAAVTTTAADHPA